MGRDGESSAIAAPSRHEHRMRESQDDFFRNCRNGAVSFSGLCIERNLRSDKAPSTRKIETS
jgi:hypothetical protein